MTKKKSAAKKGGKAAANAKLEQGAKKIRDAKKKLEPVVIKESKRPITDILKDRVEMLPGSVGVKIDKETPIEECLRILDYATTLNDHVGFIIGDVLNFGHARYGEKYQRALNQTGRAYSTLAAYAEVARKIAVKDRYAALSFSHYREVLRLKDPKKIDGMIKQLVAESKKGKLTSVKELRGDVKKQAPRKKKTAKVEDEVPYTPTVDEQALLDITEEQVRAVGVDNLAPVAKKLTGEAKDKWAKLLTPFANLCDALLK